MLYYRLYKRMKRNFGFYSPISPSLDYVTFAFLIPIAVGFVVAKGLQNFFGLSERLSFLSIFLWVVAASVYIHVCSERDKEP